MNARSGFGKVAPANCRTAKYTFVVLAALLALSAAGAGAPRPATPQELYGPLYEAVEEARVFDDDKTFADAVPKSPPAEILTAFQRDKPQSAEALKRFVAAHFVIEPVRSAPLPPKGLPLIAHIDGLWPVLVRHADSVPQGGSLLRLPYAFVVPGGRFREMYYWDSYFTMLGLAESGRSYLVGNMVGDFASLIDTYGHIPNGNRSYYLSRSQPPFFFKMVALTNKTDPAAAYARYLPELRREYAFWMKGAEGLKPGTAQARVVAFGDGAILNRYWDDSDTPRDEAFQKDRAVARAVSRPAGETYRDIRAAAESGWDFSSRWFADGKSLTRIETSSIVPVDLNSLLFGLEQAIAEGCARKADQNCAKIFHAKAASRRAAMNRYLWDDAKGTYVDYHWRRRQATGRISAAIFYPLFVGAADQTQAERVTAFARKTLLAAGGIVTTPVTTGQQWDAPNGWAPLQWVAVDGLKRYRQRGLAAAIACRWAVNVGKVYQESGKLLEKYDVVTLGRPGGGGEYVNQDGFGWTNGVTRKLLADYPAFATLPTVDRCPAPN
ncbi:alpha,alpha-trehalase [Rhizomicrobium palustre]|uniref:Alpha,alpha-trehalase n=1 Tax=Rhizomicrobium palustre TaxID=189966 RepID=A0A846MWV0_9PROT|nr:alpha,alpha-trehalase TreA [Rhizomicrobium palustre]NIK88014.1 alpha,alpha-trehalase [Rhizomicrobium palustre]